MDAVIAVAGTFDGLHAGHEALLQKAFALGENVLIGLTSDEFIRIYKPGIGHSGSDTGRDSVDMPYTTPHIRAYGVRKQELIEWLSRYGYLSRATIVSIDDPFEPVASSPDITALVVSADTKLRGRELNDLRISRGLAPLSLIVVPMLNAEDFRPISATRVRAGEIDRTGKLMMPESLRIELLKPLGRIIFSFAGRSSAKLIVSVGDLTTKMALESGITPYLMIIDNKVGRKTFSDLMPIIKKRGFRVQTVASGPGFISAEANRLIRTLPTGVIEVHGEEDLLALPAILAAPDGSIVYYGQPDKGIVEVVVTEEKKKEVHRILSGFVVS